MNLPANFWDIEQGSAEWLQARCGLVTSSRVADALQILTRKSKNGVAGDPGASRIKYRLEMALEILTGRASDHYVSRWMEEGREKEPLARVAYEMETGCEVQQVGFCLHPTLDRCGASPDGLVSESKMVEFKCPLPLTHLQYIIAGIVPEDYRPQLYWQMACGGEQFTENDFCSWHPDFPEELQLFIVTLPRDNEEIAKMEAGVKTFWQEVDREMKIIEDRRAKRSTTERELRESIAHVQRHKNVIPFGEIVP